MKNNFYQQGQYDEIIFNDGKRSFSFLGSPYAAFDVSDLENVVLLKHGSPTEIAEYAKTAKHAGIRSVVAWAVPCDHLNRMIESVSYASIWLKDQLQSNSSAMTLQEFLDLLRHSSGTFSLSDGVVMLNGQVADLNEFAEHLREHDKLTKFVEAVAGLPLYGVDEGFDSPDEQELPYGNHSSAHEALMDSVEQARDLLGVNLTPQDTASSDDSPR
jgi:hypothetical protein